MSRHQQEEDSRKASKYVTQRAAAELEEEMNDQWLRTQHKKREIAARAVEGAVHVTNQMLFEEIRQAKVEDEHKADTERAKFQAVRQGVDYDQFEQNVKGASLKPTRTKAPGGNHGPGVLLHGGSGASVPGLAKKMLNKEAGGAAQHRWLGDDDSKKGDLPLSNAVSRLFAARAPAEEEALKLYLSNSKEFVRRWRALGSKANERYLLLRAVDPAALSGIFKTEMESDVMTDVTSNLAHVLPRVCEAVGAHGGEEDMVKEREAAAAHAVRFLDALTALKRFELNAKFMSKKERGELVAVVEWCVGVDGSLQEQAAAVKKAFRCE